MERIPILRMGPFLLITIQVDMHDKLALQLQDDVTERISEYGSAGVLIDISSLEIVDSFIGRMLSNIAAMSRVLGAETVVVGMQPAVAITLVELGMSLPGVRTALNVESGMELLNGSLSQLGTMNDSAEQLPLQNSSDVVVARQKVRQWAIELRFSLVDQTKLVTAASELARNALDHGQGGQMTVEVVNGLSRSGLRLVFEDNGPGIPDIEQALKDGFTTGSGMGLGLGGSKRLVNEFSIESEVGKGTKITVVRWK
jgi:anti-sigma regulatory factor (Ser/Thr protein kinase)/anti-anti-sigma regulatory factor